LCIFSLFSLLFLFFYFFLSCFRFSNLFAFSFLHTFLARCASYFWDGPEPLYSCRHQTSLVSNVTHYCLRFRADDWFLLSRRKAIREGVIHIATCRTHARC
jgi:hypothetical protein